MGTDLARSSRVPLRFFIPVFLHVSPECSVFRWSSTRWTAKVARWIASQRLSRNERWQATVHRHSHLGFARGSRDDAANSTSTSRCWPIIIFHYSGEAVHHRSSRGSSTTRYHLHEALITCRPTALHRHSTEISSGERTKPGGNGMQTSFSSIFLSRFPSPSLVRSCCPLFSYLASTRRNRVKFSVYDLTKDPSPRTIRGGGCWLRNCNWELIFRDWADFVNWIMEKMWN